MPAHTGHTRAWEKTVAVYRENGKIAACVWNEGCYSGEQVFLFDSRQRAEDRELLREMLRFAKTFGGDVQRGGKLRCADLTVPGWHDTLKKLRRRSIFFRPEISTAPGFSHLTGRNTRSVSRKATPLPTAIPRRTFTFPMFTGPRLPTAAPAGPESTASRRSMNCAPCGITARTWTCACWIPWGVP